MAQYKLKGGIVARGTVVVAAPAQTITVPVVNGDGAGLLRVWGLVLCPNTALAINVLVNGVNTNMTSQNVNGRTAAVAADQTQLGIEEQYGALVNLQMLTSKRGAAALKRGGWCQIGSLNATRIAGAYVSGFQYADVATLITSIALDSGSATGFQANSYLYYEEVAI